MSESTSDAPRENEGPTQKRLNREAWHKPLVSIIVTHHNYSHMVEDALLSILDQTHENWECVVVDDASEPQHVERLEAIVAEINHPKISILTLEDNQGQTGAFFAGLDVTSGEFVCPLDPDDRYAETFLEEALAGHLNQKMMCPILSTDQYLCRNGETISASSVIKMDLWATLHQSPLYPAINGEHDLYYYPQHVGGWLWSTTSCLMCRRTALIEMKPDRPTSYKISLDAYIAQGCHYLGGTLFLYRPLVYRTLHENNSFIRSSLFSLLHNNTRHGVVSASEKAAIDVVRAISSRGLGPPPILKEANRPDKRFIRKWQNSFRKRWNRLVGKGQRQT